MQVVNVKVKHIRPEYQNLKEWMKDENNCYIGRRGIVFIKKKDGSKERWPKKASKYANPFKVDKKDPNGRKKCIDQYREYATKKIEQGEWTKVELLELKNKNLGCWCKPEKCHGDVLKDLIEKNMKK